MNIKWLIGMATAFYCFVVALFWPVERQILSTNDARVDQQGYATARVVFSEEHVVARVPTTLQLQERGLAGVTSLPDSEGMLWRYDPPQRVAFWMKGMVMPIDFLWLSDGHIVDLTERVQPPASPVSTDLSIIDPGVPVDGVLEVAAGFVQRHGLKIGDIAQIE